MRRDRFRRGALATILTLLLASLLVLGWSSPAHAVPTISVEPPSGAPVGETVTVIGDGFLPGESVSIAYVGSSFGPVFADDAGRFTLTITVPAAPVDSHPLEAMGDQGSVVSVEYRIVAAPATTGVPESTDAPATTEAPDATAPPTTAAPEVVGAETPVSTESGSPTTTALAPSEAAVTTSPPESESDSDSTPTANSTDDSTPWGWYLVTSVVLVSIIVLLVVIGSRRGQLRDTSWVKKLGEIDAGLPPVAPSQQAPDWSLHVHDGKKWVPIRNPKNPAYEYRVRLVSNVAIATTPKHRITVTQFKAQRVDRPRSYSTHEIAGMETLRRYRGHSNRVIDEATQEIDGANLTAAATIDIDQSRGSDSMAHLDPDRNGLEIAPLARVDDVTRVELVARGVGGAELKNRWAAQGASWKREVARYAFTEGDQMSATLFEDGRDVVRGLLDVSTKRAVMVASTNVESTVELDLAYPVATLAPGETKTPPPKSEQQKIKESVTAAVKAALGPLTSKVPGFEFFTTVATSDLSAASGSGGGATHYSGRNQSTKTAASFTTEIVNNATVAAAIHHLRSDNDDNVDVEGATQVYHHIKIDSEYNGPAMKWANGKPEFSIEIGRAAAAGAPPFTPPPAAPNTPTPDAVIKIGGKVATEIYRYEGSPTSVGRRALDTYTMTRHWEPRQRP